MSENGKLPEQQEAAEDTYLLPEPLAQAIMAYLVSRPYVEVYELVNALQHTPTVPKPPAVILAALD